MPRKPTGRPNGRPPKAIDLKLVEELATIHCTITEIAAVLGVSTSTLTDREGFRDCYERGLEQGKMSLRRAQFKAALAGNSRMLTWMGMQILGQRNKASNEISGPDGGPIEHSLNLTNLSDDEMAQLEQLAQKAATAPSDQSGTVPA